jgi:hypothetical protein
VKTHETFANGDHGQSSLITSAHEKEGQDTVQHTIFSREEAGLCLRHQARGRDATEMIVAYRDLRIKVGKQETEYIYEVAVNSLDSSPVDFEFCLFDDGGAECIRVFPGSCGVLIGELTTRVEKLCLGIEPVSEAYLEHGTEEEIAHEKGTEVEGEALAECSGASIGEFLDNGCKRECAAFRVACEPRGVRIQGEKVILLEITIREVQESFNSSNGAF